MRMRSSWSTWVLAAGMVYGAGQAVAQTGQPGSASSTPQNPNVPYGAGTSSSPGYGGMGRGPIGPISPSTVDGLGVSNDPTPLNPQLQRDPTKLRNMERQKQLISDTQKLVALANQLQADVSKSSKDTLSVDVIKKADEIEKLAHNVREKMKNAN